MSEQWTPPPNCTPCWINVFATDVQRARKFYQEAFGWKFRDTTTRMDGIEEDPSQIAHFNLGPRCPGGGITKVSEVVSTKGKGGNVFYLMADDIEAVMKKIVAAGDTEMTEIQPEGGRALMQHFEDTEGNYWGLYMLNEEFRV